MSFFQNTCKPEGIGGKIMVNMMNAGHSSMAEWGFTHIIFKHILPNIISPVIVIATLEMAKIVLIEASLSFLGYGVPITIPTWGRMLSEARDNILTDPWQCIFPGLCITLTVLGVNLLGDWLRDYLDPKLDV